MRGSISEHLVQVPIPFRIKRKSQFMEFVAPHVAMVLSVLLPTNMQVAAGVLVLAAVSWREKTPGALQTIVVAWIAWTTQRNYVPVLVEDGLHVSDTTLLMIGAVFFGLGVHRTFDASLYPLGALITCAMAALPIRPIKGLVGCLWSAAVYSGCAGGMMWVDQTTETKWHLRALCCVWILFVRNEPVYVACELCYALFVASKIYHKTSEKIDPKPQPASIPPPMLKPSNTRRTPKPMVAHTPTYLQPMRLDVIDPEAREVEPFQLGRN